MPIQPTDDGAIISQAIKRAVTEEVDKIVAEETNAALARVEERIKTVTAGVAARLGTNIQLMASQSAERFAEVEYVIKVKVTS